MYKITVVEIHVHAADALRNSKALHVCLAVQRAVAHLKIFTSEFTCCSVKHWSIVSGNQTKLHSLEIQKIIPQTEFYMTYHGSFTQPGCEEVVTWVLLNKPLYFSREQVGF